MTTIKQVYSDQEMIEIGSTIMDFAKANGPDMYFHRMTNEDVWYEICLDAVPGRESKLIDWISATPSKTLPGEELGELFYRAEQVVFGATIAEYLAWKPAGLLFSGFCVVRQAMHRASLILEGKSAY